MKLINDKLPRLKNVSRPAAWQILTFSIFNIFLGIALFTAQATTLRFFIVNDITSPQFWGIVFFSIGITKMFGYLTNRWNIMRYMNVPALFVKFFWLIALIARQIEQPGTNVFLILMFAALAALQVQLYLYFPTNREGKNGKTPVGTLTIAKEIIK